MIVEIVDIGIMKSNEIRKGGFNLKATVLVDNIGTEIATGEWGLSIYIEQAGKNILLDTGASNRFLVNAKALEKDIGAVDYGVLSHAHYDHANGMQAFFEENENAKFYLQKGTGENCYFKKWFIHKYIGIPKHILTRQKDRIEYVTGKYKLYENVYLIPHTTKGLETIGAANKMYIRDGRRWRPDDFAHEQSLVIEEEDGLIIFNSCSHGGADNIINEVSKLFEKPAKMMIGGFHIFQKGETEIRQLAEKIKATGVKKIYTGHCTGGRAFRILQQELGDMVEQLKVGLVIEA